MESLVLYSNNNQQREYMYETTFHTKSGKQSSIKMTWLQVHMYRQIFAHIIVDIFPNTNLFVEGITLNSNIDFKHLKS